METLSASAIGFATEFNGEILEVFYPAPSLGLNPNLVNDFDSTIGVDQIRGVSRIQIETVINDLSEKPTDVADAYLRLHLLSHRLVKPRSINLDGIFAVLPNLAWTNLGAVLPSELNNVKSRALSNQVPFFVLSVDKFPRMIDYVIPSGVRIADGDRVRLGAYLASGTTVMHEGFVNFNAGTLGASMVEGRISAGVVIGDGSDIGGGASIMGTLSGGGKEVISVGEKSLIGANSGIGISIGNNCVVEAGLYVTAGSKVSLPDGTSTKAAALSGEDNLLFRRNSQTGAIEVVSRTNSWGGLNTALHTND
ncbi:MAG: 2,3,4,5-tetrahydropyridine-2,6-dicarboxylate N-succinyltransferase [Candidatus Nanopelagicales bacterium]